MVHPVHTYGTQHTSCEGAFHVVNDLVIVTDDVVPVDNDRHLLTQVEPHEPGLLMLALGQADIPLFTGQALLGDHQPHLQAPGSERGEGGWTQGTLCPGGGGVQERRSEVTHKRGHLLAAHSWALGQGAVAQGHLLGGWREMQP